MQPGTVPVAGPIDTTALGDSYPSHKASRGLGGFRCVANNTERDAITTERREEGMWVKVLSSGIIFELNSDLTTWTAVVVGSQVNYVNTWNAATNTPTLADNTGTNGNGYIVGVGGTRNLGSGSQTFAAGDEVIHLAGIWQKVSGTVSGVVSVNGFTNAVNLTLGDIPASTDANVVTDNQLDSFPAGASASDPLVLQSDLAAITVLSSGQFCPELYADGQTLGDGTLRTLASLGYNNTTAAAYWSRVNSNYTINVNTMSIDWIAWQEACLAMFEQGLSEIKAVAGGLRGYCPSQSIDLPLHQLNVNYYRRSNMFTFDGRGSVMANRTSTNFPIFNRYFANQSDVSGANAYLLDYGYHFVNWKAIGRNTNNILDCFLRLGATTHSTAKNIITSEMGCPLLYEFALELLLENIKHESYGLYGTVIRPGTWSGGNSSDSGVNQVNVLNHRCVNASGKTPTAGIFSGGGGGLVFDDLTFEGYSGSVHHFLSQTPGQTASESACTLRNLYFETAGASRAAIKFEADKGDFFVDKWNNVVDTAVMPVFIEAATKSAPPTGVREMYVQISNAQTQQGNNGIAKLRAVSQQSLGYRPFFDVRGVNMNNNTKLNVAANFDTSVSNSYIPADEEVTFIPSPI